ncbi:MAG: histidine--tRNA ligase [Candidatus Magasanikbacteria bacterium CG_4_9_14_0_2_um_filter_41_10]|uniref:Histidine--tRNA ligase n=1 Tax=Candidatus Magasanikbacteria bacterium CG_4_10_14_0_2_um_filter_41_31 TaxID=1974639 RepID=A0A2M7V3I8_9BACT|nr:MAG: histidine--tRNA ligase [Candidatus Magasanikbacteria bacterium CG_4_10_14_0_2_um_filter_41_31]PJC53798.1 MAG: histidine--tRNA ligase [Candidatus Magasanikbacteria bacterium CG_4_9_14_0_2_um_filter_41_10]
MPQRKISSTKKSARGGSASGGKKGVVKKIKKLVMKKPIAKKKVVQSKTTKTKPVAKKKPVSKSVASGKKTVVPKKVEKNVPVKPSAPAKIAAPYNGEKKSKKEKIPQIQPLRGMRDLHPKDAKFWRSVYRASEQMAEAYNFQYMEVPVLEDAKLFTRSIGKGTDVVDKEMYVFGDKDGSEIGLRPEFTAGFARAYITHGMQSDPQPIKVWTSGSLFRHDRPQAGRYREFRQFDCETMGTRDAAVDAELITVAYNFLKDLGLETTVRVNSIGSPEDRANYVIELTAYLRSKRSYLSELSKKRIAKNPLRILDSKDPQDKEVIEEAPQIIDWLSEESKKFFMRVLEYLDHLNIPYILDATLVRGLDYYTDTVFELFRSDTEEGSQTALGGGGRYDRLIEQLGGPQTPAAGFAIGLDRVVLALKDLRNNPKALRHAPKKSPVYFAQLGDQARQHTLRLIEDLRQENIITYHNLGKSSLKSQLEQANEIGVTHTLILGQKEVQDGTIIIRDMESGIQEIIDQGKIVREVMKLLK